MVFTAGTRLGSYSIVAPVGAGGMGEVYRARDTKLGRDVAIKILPEEFSGDNHRLARFEREAHLLAALNHPNIATIYALEVSGRQHFLVMELVEGETLAERLARKTVPVEEALPLFRHIAEGLEAAHNKGIVHRDLKPSNVKITLDGKPKILDFGLAKALARDTAGADPSQSPTLSVEATKAGVLLGTAPYMSPEQARGKPVDTRTDIWAFGCCLFEALTGKAAFLGETSSDTIAKILEREPDWDLLPKDTPAMIRSLLHQCLHKDPTRRLSDVADVRTAIDRTLSPTDLETRRATRRNWWLLAAIGVASVLIAVAVGLWFGRGGEKPEPDVAAVSAVRDPVSIAVLPFTDLSPGRDQEYFADGLAEELLNVLAQIRGLKVVGRTSSFQFKGKNVDLRVIGEKLNVAMILEGSVRKADGHTRITAQLASTDDGFHVWSESYDMELDDIFAVQQAIARSVAEAVAGPLVGQEAQAREPRGRNADAYNAYLQGHHLAQRKSEEDLERAIGYFEQALALDSGYALAWAGLATVYRRLADYVPEVDPRPKAIHAAERALELDDTLAEAWAALGANKWTFEWDWSGADAAYQRALELNPGSASVVRGAGYLAGCLGRLDEAIELTQRAVSLDPLQPYTHGNLGMFLFYARRFDEAEMALKKELELNPESSQAHATLGLAYLFDSRPEMALREVQMEPDRAFQLQARALVYPALGQRAQGEASLAQLIEEYHGDSAYQIAGVYAYWGDVDSAFVWLEKAYSQRDAGLGQMKSEPLLANLHDDPRWTAFLEKMGLAEPDQRNEPVY